MALAFRQLPVVKCGIESTFNTNLTTIKSEKRKDHILLNLYTERKTVIIRKRLLIVLKTMEWVGRQYGIRTVDNKLNQVVNFLNSHDHSSFLISILNNRIIL